MPRKMMDMRDNDTVHEPPLRAKTASNVRQEARLQAGLMAPLMGTYLADLCLFYIDHAIVGRLGALELGAVGLSGMVFFELIIIASAILSIVGVIVGNAFGAGNAETLSRAVRKGLLASAFLSVPVIILGWFLMSILALTGQQPEIITLGEEYIHAALWMVPPALGFVVLRSFVTGLSRPGVVTLVFTLALPVNLALNWWLVYGGLGVPALGVAGAGYASSIVGWLMFFGLVAHIQRDPMLSRYRVFCRFFERDRELSKKIWSLGLPVAGLTIVEGSFFNFVIIVAGLFGAMALAANQIVINTIAVAWTVAMSIGEAAAVRVSQEVGHAHLDAAFRAGWLAIGVSCVSGVVFMVMLLLAPDMLATIFLDTDAPDNAQVLTTVGALGLVAAAVALFDIIQVVAARCLRGLEDTVVPMILTAVGYWVLALPLGLLLAFVYDYGLVGLWVGLATGIAFSGLLMVYRWHRFAATVKSRERFS